MLPCLPVHPPRRSPLSSRDIRRVLALSLLLAATGCGDHSASRRVADRFLTLYYVEDKVVDAMDLCSGDARERLDVELRIMHGVPPPTPGERPPVTFEFQREEVSPGGRPTYVYEVRLPARDKIRLFAKLEMVQERDRWFVATLEEKERTPGA